MPQTQTQYFPFGGGLDIVTPALSVHPGRALAAVNYEPWFNGGYRRIDGFERFDGRPRPSVQSFVGFDVTSVEDLTVGVVITGGISGATGTIIGLYEDDGTFGIDSIGVTKVTGTFVLGEDIGITGTNVDEEIRPNVAVVDSGSNVVSGAFGDVDEGVGFAENATGLFCEGDVPSVLSVSNVWAAGTIDFGLDDVDAAITTINSWTLRVVARVLRDGPETDDTATYRFTFAPAGDSETLDYTEGDVGLNWITRTVTEAVSATTPTGINAAVIALSQFAFTQNGNAGDGLRIEIDAIDIILDVDGPVTIRSTPTALAAPTSDLEDQFLLATQDEYRTDIGVVPGSGPVRGAWQRNAAVFAVRDNVGVTAGILHQSSAAGWTTTGITMGLTLFFTLGGGGGTNPLPGRQRPK